MSPNEAFAFPIPRAIMSLLIRPVNLHPEDVMRRAFSILVIAAVAAPLPAAEPAAESLPAGVLLRVGASKFRVGIGCRSLAYSTDGKSLFSGGGDGIIRVWDVATGRETKQWSTAGNGIALMRLSPDGKQIAVCDTGRSISIWDAATGEKRASLQTPAYGEIALAWSTDGKRLVCGGRDQYLRIVDA